MQKDLKIKKRPSGSKNEPMAISEVLIEYFASDEPIARAYRKRLFKEVFPDTHLDVDLKLLTPKPGRMPVGAQWKGTLWHDGEEHFTFVKDNLLKRKMTIRRNPLVFSGRCTNVHQLPDNTLRLEFNHPQFTESFTFRDFCVAAAQELLTIAQLFGEENLEK